MRIGLGISPALYASTAAFTPTTLFANGEQGAWYDPSDLSTLFQDQAGTTPVTAGGDPVRLVLDKSRGLELGPELSSASWISIGGATVSVSDGVVSVSTEALSGGAYQDITTTANLILVSAKRRRVSGDGNSVIWGIPRTGNFSVPNTQVGGTYTDFTEVRFLLTRESGASGVRIYLQRVSSSAPTTLQFKDVSVRELFSVPLTQPALANSFTAVNSGSVWGIVSDYAGDVLPATLPFAIDGEILIAGTGGTIIEPVSYVSGSTFNLGPTSYTGGTPGILRAIGPIVGVVLLDRAFTEAEKAQLIDYYKGKGAKGLLVPGPELVANSGNPFTVTTGWTTQASSLSVEDGALRVTKTNTNGQARSSITSSSGGFYKYKATLKGRTTTSSVMFLLGPTAGSLTISDRIVVTSSDPVVSPITVDGVVTSPDSSIHISLYGAFDTGQYDDWSEVSIRELRPQEDW